MKQFQSQDWVAVLSNTDERDAALSELRELLVHRLHRAFCSNARVDDAFIEDIVQDGLVAVLGSLDQFERRSQFTTWATTIAIRIAMAQMRRRRWQDTSLDQLMEIERPSVEKADTSNSADAEFSRSQLVLTMHRVIREQLTEKQRMVLQAELHGVPQQEIARCIGCNRNAVYKLTHDARKRLKSGMTEAGYSVEDLASLQGTP